MEYTVFYIKMSIRDLWLELGYPSKCMFLYRPTLVTVLKLCKYSFCDLTIPISYTFPCMFAYFGLLGIKFMNNAYFEDF